MSEHAYKQLISGRTKGALAGLCRAVLRGFSWPYGLLMTLRNIAFDIGLKKTHRVNVPVISIGNLTTGGTGKTPVVATVVKLLQQLGHRPGIVSRGYGADETGENEEKRVLRQLCPDVPHEQNPNRIAAATQLLANENVDVIVLDDAFQHRRIHRDLNVVLIDATNPFGHGYQLPRGLLRESLNGLKRADIVLVTRADTIPSAEIRAIVETVQQHNSSLKDNIYQVSFRPNGLLWQSGEEEESSATEGKSVAILTAIGNPEAFVDTCRQLGANIVMSTFFPDHHHYTPEQIENVAQEAANAGAELILTTLKDFVKIPSGRNNIVAVQIDTAFENDAGRRALSDKLAAAVAAGRIESTDRS